MRISYGPFLPLSLGVSFSILGKNPASENVAKATLPTPDSIYLDSLIPPYPHTSSPTPPIIKDESTDFLCKSSSADSLSPLLVLVYEPFSLIQKMSPSKHA